jgi:uncharacterized membrane protein YqjE
MYEENMADEENLAPHQVGFIESLRALSVTALDLLRVRVELISLEWQEERERGKEVLVLAVTAALLLALGLLVLTLFVIVLFWDTYRLSAIAVVALLYIGGGVCSLLSVRKKMRNRPPPFSATLQEFSSDLQALKSRKQEQSRDENLPREQS